MTNSVLRLLPVEHTPEQQTVQGDHPPTRGNSNKEGPSHASTFTVVEVHFWLPSVIMGSISPVFAMLFVALGLMVCSALFVPKGPNQVYVKSSDLFARLTKPHVGPYGQL